MKKSTWVFLFFLSLTFSGNLTSKVSDSSDLDVTGSLSAGVYSQCFANIPGIGSEGLDLIAPQLSMTVASAFNPLLTMLAVGTCSYFSTDLNSSELPMPAQPWFLLALGLLVTVFVAKDYLLALFPAAKIPLDNVEAVVQSVSSPVAVAFFISSLSTSTQLSGTEALAVVLGSGSEFQVLQAGLGSSLGGIISGILVMVGLVYIFIFSLALHFLIALCPVPLLDTAIKYFRNAICVFLILVSIISPTLGLIMLGLLAFFSYRVGDAAFRSATAGVFYLFSNFSRKQKPFEGACWAATREVSGIKKNIVGKFSVDPEGLIHFVYRPYLVFKSRKVTLDNESVALRQNFLSLILTNGTSGQGNELLAVPYSYRDALGSRFTLITAERESFGFASGIGWMKDQFRTPSDAS